mgnify:CR=1 FL=1
MTQINNLNDIDDQSESDSPQLPTSSVLNFENNDDTTEESYETDLTQDSVKTYLKSMSTVKLLTREDEVAIAMRIEAGRNKTIKALYQNPIIFRHFIEWYNGLSNGTILLRDIINIDTVWIIQISTNLAKQFLHVQNTNNIVHL